MSSVHQISHTVCVLSIVLVLVLSKPNDVCCISDLSFIMHGLVVPQLTVFILYWFSKFGVV